MGLTLVPGRERNKPWNSLPLGDFEKTHCRVTPKVTPIRTLLAPVFIRARIISPYPLPSSNRISFGSIWMMVRVLRTSAGRVPDCDSGSHQIDTRAPDSKAVIQRIANLCRSVTPAQPGCLHSTPRQKSEGCRSTANPYENSHPICCPIETGLLPRVALRATIGTKSCSTLWILSNNEGWYFM